jgi:hypothetical protein
MNSEINKIQNLLKSDRKKLIRIKLDSNSTYLKRPNIDSKPLYPSYIFDEDIATTGMDLFSYLNSLLKKHNSSLNIQLRRVNGNSTVEVKEYKNTIRYILPEKPSPEAQNQTNMESSQNTQRSQNQNYSYGQNNAEPDPKLMYLVDLTTRANESGRNLSLYMSECQKTLELQTKISQLNAENMDLKTFKSVADRNMEIERKDIERKSKNFGDSEAAKQGMALLPELIAAMTGRSNRVSEVYGQNSAAPTLSTVKSTLINHISNPQMDDSIVGLLDRSAAGCMVEGPFAMEYMDLLDKHNL